MSGIKKVLDVTLTIALVGLILLNLYVLVARTVLDEPLPKVFGYTTAVVRSGSMVPAVDMNDLVIIRGQSDYQTGDVVTYVGTGSTPVTHRIIEQTPAGYITQGDANNAPDAVIAKDQVVGRVIAVVPWVGALGAILFSPVGISLLIAIVFICVIWRYRKTPTSSDSQYRQDI